MGLFDRKDGKQAVRELMKTVNTYSDFEKLPDEDKKLIEDNIPSLVDDLPPKYQEKLANMMKASEVLDKMIEGVLEYCSRPETSPEGCNAMIRDSIGKSVIELSKIFKNS